jgi:hypothetical protein
MSSDSTNDALFAKRDARKRSKLSRVLSQEISQGASRHFILDIFSLAAANPHHRFLTLVGFFDDDTQAGIVAIRSRFCETVSAKFYG